MKSKFWPKNEKWPLQNGEYISGELESLPPVFIISVGGKEVRRVRGENKNKNKSTTNKNKKSTKKSTSKGIKQNKYAVLAYYKTKPKNTSTEFANVVSGQIEEDEIFYKGKFTGKSIYIYDYVLESKNISHSIKHLNTIGQLQFISQIDKISKTDGRHHNLPKSKPQSSK